MTTHRVAIIGGGITGAMAASTLDAAGVAVTLFDQGRRGPGGRASHRSVDPVDRTVLPDNGPVAAASSSSMWEFDHGCQFTRADTARMRRLVSDWVAKGWAAPWDGRFGRAGGGCGDGAQQSHPPLDFFGLPSDGSPVYVGFGGMHRLPRSILDATGATVRAGVRVAGVRPSTDTDEDTGTDTDTDKGAGAAAAAGPGAGGRPSWVLSGVSGNAAFHDTPEADAARQAGGNNNNELGRFDAVLFTDISSSFGAWHRASAGVPDALAARVRSRVRVPLFSCMVVVPGPLGVPLDGFVGCGGDDGALWWAARNDSKPGLQPPGGDDPAAAAATTTTTTTEELGECWTLVSTPGFAAREIAQVEMRDPVTGAFRPQDNAYLNSGPGPKLYDAFAAAVAPLLPAGEAPLPAAPAYLQAQRWGSALPAPAAAGGRDSHGRGESTRTISGVAYETQVPPLVTCPPGQQQDREEPDEEEEQGDFVADDERRLYYAGDFCSRRPPGFEAACLSGLDAATHIAKQLLQEN